MTIKKAQQNTSEHLAAEIFIPSMNTALSQAAQQSQRGEDVVNGFVNAFATVLLDLMHEPPRAIALMKALTAHMQSQASVTEVHH